MFGSDAVFPDLVAHILGSVASLGKRVPVAILRSPSVTTRTQACWGDRRTTGAQCAATNTIDALEQILRSNWSATQVSTAQLDLSADYLFQTASQLAQQAQRRSDLLVQVGLLYPMPNIQHMYGLEFGPDLHVAHSFVTCHAITCHANAGTVMLESNYHNVDH